MAELEDPATVCDVDLEPDGLRRASREPQPSLSDQTASQRPRVSRADNGFEAPLNELIIAPDKPLLWSIDDRMRLTKRRATGRILIRNREVSRLTLASGRALDMTSGQEVLMVDGWSSPTKLSSGSRIAVPRRLPEPAHPTPMHDSEIIMLAHMIGDGSCVKRQPIRYASVDENNLAAVTIAAAHFGVTPVRDEYAAARVTTLRLRAPYRLTHGKRNPIAEWLDGLGLFGMRSHEKFVPREIFALPNEQVALFLRHLWATDGSVRWDANIAHGQVYYASTSRRLIDDVVNLLLRMGVQSSITRTTKEGYRDCWHLTINRAANQIVFLTKVGVHGERGVKAREVIRQLAGRTRRPGRDTIPIEIWTRVKASLKQRNWSEMDFAVATNTRFDGPRMWTHAPGRTRLHRIAGVMDDPVLHDLATNDVYWDKVSAITRLGRREVYTFEGLMHPVVVEGVFVRQPG
ncbi:LAGLIDADG family homing endonuclease [Mycobacterium sp. ITM-2016-00318]|uniref:LAGLIDADG family homing endonuclease n=1 Tax=Mycobacterium sp. ITM-2016-00318 TaxID=2099693 RepID=UPI00287F52D9|nr:LAGLIDADG family homing endonuclease [Mycobacterium sp. ITM-2016-00318]WNG92886.1 LAGLIDADG family homing endonuclease [Mycobacterium sp. ITM-2016-00318]